MKPTIFLLPLALLGCSKEPEPDPLLDNGVRFIAGTDMTPTQTGEATGQVHNWLQTGVVSAAKPTHEAPPCWEDPVGTVELTFDEKTGEMMASCNGAPAAKLRRLDR